MKTKNLKEYTIVGSLYVSKELLKFVNNEVLKGTKIKPKNFWNGFEESLYILKPKKNLINIAQEKIYSIKDMSQKLNIFKNPSLKNILKKRITLL